VSIKKKLLWLLLIPAHTFVTLAYLENNGSVQLPPAISTACGTTPDPNDFSITYANPECLPKWRFWYRDPVFNSSGPDTGRIMRLTDALNMGLKGTAHIYSSINAFNEGKTKIIIGHRLLNGSDQIAIHDIATGTYTLMPPGYGSSFQPRWSRTNPNIIYLMPPVNPPNPVYIKQYDVSTGLITNVGGPLSFNGHTYDSTVQHPSEDDICFGGDHLVKRVKWQGTEYVVVFSISQQSVVGEYAITGLQPGDSIDNVELAPAETAADRAADRNDIVLVNFSYGEPRADSFNTWGKGMWKFTFDETQPLSDRIIRNQQALTATSHHDLGLDDDGTPIMVTPNGSMYNAVPGCQGSGKYGMEKVSLLNPDGNLPSSQRTTSKCLMNSLDWATLAVHVSVADRAGWAYMDVYLPFSNDLPSNSNPTANWKPYANEIVQLKLDGTAVRRLAHHRARLTNQWYNQPNASVSRDGKTLVFGSNFGYGNYDITQYNDVYLIDNIDIGSGGSDSGVSTYTLGVSKNGSGTGTVTSSPSGINCGATCNAQYTNGTAVTLSASPDNGAVFTGWSGACTGTGSCTVTMDSAKSVTATFDAVTVTYTLAVSKTGSGTGSVLSSPTDIDHCGTSCSTQFTSGTPLTLYASPAAGSAFTGWAGACSGTGSCTLTMNSAKSVTATFNAMTYTLTVSKTGSGTGSVLSSPTDIDHCGTSCSAQLTSGTLLTLYASPAAGSAFAGWTGACSGTGNCTLTMDSAKSVIATFNLTTTTYIHVYSGNSASIALTQGDRVTFSCNGTSAKWIGFNVSVGGIANVYVDGLLQNQIDTFYDAPPLYYQSQANYTTPQMPSGEHT